METSIASSSENALRPVIDGAEQYKYYQSPAGLKEIRSKQKVAIIFGYVGENYYGLQWNKLADMPTVEAVLLKALYETDMISLTNFSSMKVQQLLGFERASRTDKGVHALYNVISVSIMLPYSKEYVRKYEQQQQQQQPQVCEHEEERKLEEQKNLQSTKVPMYSCELAKELLNKAVPNDIHVYQVCPVTRSFNAYMNCNNREYKYYIPTFAFMNRNDYTTKYFHADIAPSRPTLMEIGFKAKNVANVESVNIKENKSTLSNNTVNTIEEVCHKSELQELDEGSVDNAEENNDWQYQHEQEQEPSRIYNERNFVNVRGRRNHGHFPKRKSARKRLREENKEEEQKYEEEHKDEPKVKEFTDSSAKLQSNGTVNENTTLDIVNESDNNYALHTKTEKMPSKHDSNYIAFYNDSLFESMILFQTVMESVMDKVAKYRITSEQLNHVRELFSVYEGTHCFHNFTPGGFSHDPSCHRFIREVTVSEPFIVNPNDAMMKDALNNWKECDDFATETKVERSNLPNMKSSEDGEHAISSKISDDDDEEDDVDAVDDEKCSIANNSIESSVNGCNNVISEKCQKSHIKHMTEVYGECGMEVVCVKFNGQSFMLNQIRKMIGAVMCMTAADFDANFLRLTLLKKGLRCAVPMAPANGLFLSHLDFSGYNKRLRRIQDDGNNGANKLAICVDAVCLNEVHEMRNKIVAVVLRNEMAYDLIGRWMRSLRHVIRLVWGVELPEVLETLN